MKEISLKQRAVLKVIACIDSSTNIDHLAACNKMIELIYNKPYSIRKSTLTYLTLKHRKKRIEIYDG